MISTIYIDKQSISCYSSSCSFTLTPEMLSSRTCWILLRFLRAESDFIPWIQPLSPQSLTGSPPQRTRRNSFAINAFRTLFTLTEGIPHSFHFWNSPLSYITICFQPLTGTLFCNSFLFKFMHRVGGVPPIVSSPSSPSLHPPQTHHPSPSYHPAPPSA